jgi:hypothetical protein
MKTRITAGGILAFALLIGCADAADALKSGPQVGDGVGVFEPLNVTGAFAGKKQCLV